MEYKQGDNIKNTDKCKPGYKYNTRLKSCIPNAAYVDAAGNVRLAEPIGYNDGLKPKPPSTPEQAPDAMIDPESKRRTAREKGNARTAYQAAAQSAKPAPKPRSN